MPYRTERKRLQEKTKFRKGKSSQKKTHPTDQDPEKKVVAEKKKETAEKTFLIVRIKMKIFIGRYNLRNGGLEGGKITILQWMRGC